MFNYLSSVLQSYLLLLPSGLQHEGHRFESIATPKHFKKLFSRADQRVCLFPLKSVTVWQT